MSNYISNGAANRVRGHLVGDLYTAVCDARDRILGSGVNCELCELRQAISDVAGHTHAFLPKRIHGDPSPSPIF